MTWIEPIDLQSMQTESRSRHMISWIILGWKRTVTGVLLDSGVQPGGIFLRIGRV